MSGSLRAAVARQLAALGLLAGLAATLAACGDRAEPAPRTHTVVRGDTLSRIAARYGTRVATLREVNGLTSDTIDVGQILTLPDDAGAAAPRPDRRPVRDRRPDRPAPDGSARDPLPPRPAPKPCLRGPTDVAGEHAAAASEGLSVSDVRGAVRAVMPLTARCIDATPPAGTLQVAVTVGCDGVVARTAVAEDPGWPAEITACVRDVLSRAAFPAHALPEGDTFLQPVGWTP